MSRLCPLFWFPSLLFHMTCISYGPLFEFRSSILMNDNGNEVQNDIKYTKELTVAYSDIVIPFITVTDRRITNGSDTEQ